VNGFNLTVPAAKRQRYQYDHWLTARCKQGSYSPFFWRAMGPRLPLVEAVVLSHLISIGRAAPRVDGWFPARRSS
jgi:hypothetical protein